MTTDWSKYQAASVEPEVDLGALVSFTSGNWHLTSHPIKLLQAMPKGELVTDNLRVFVKIVGTKGIKTHQHAWRCVWDRRGLTGQEFSHKQMSGKLRLVKPEEVGR